MTGVVAIVRRWWPLPVAIALALITQQVAYVGRYDVGGHAREHLNSGTFVFLASAVAFVLLWTTPAARRSILVLAGVAVWLGAGVAIAVGNARVVDALINAGQRTTPTEDLVESAVVDDAHSLANTAPLVAIVGAMAIVLGCYLVKAASPVLAGSAAVLNVLVPYWIVPGFGVVVVAVARIIAREKAARATAAAAAARSPGSRAPAATPPTELR